MPEFDSEAFLDGLLAAIENSSGGSGFSCPVCQSSEWTVVDGVIPLELRGDESRTIQTVPVVCNNCAYIAQFAIGED